MKIYSRTNLVRMNHGASVRINPVTVRTVMFVGYLMEQNGIGVDIPNGISTRRRGFLKVTRSGWLISNVGLGVSKRVRGIALFRLRGNLRSAWNEGDTL